MTFAEKLTAAAVVAKQIEDRGCRVLGVTCSFDGNPRIQMADDEFRQWFAGTQVRREVATGAVHYYAEIDGMTVTACESVREVDLVTL
jgi:hypothetical protein